MEALFDGWWGLEVVVEPPQEVEKVEDEAGELEVGYHGYQKPQPPPPTMREVSLTPGKATTHSYTWTSTEVERHGSSYRRA